MNFPEMIYKVTLLIFSNIWIYLGMMLFILTIRGDITKGLKSVGTFFGNIKSNYKKLLSKSEIVDKTKPHVK